MPTRLSPGVYIDEVPAGSAPIEGVGTAVAAFVGLAETGPVNQATLISNWRQYTATFGGFTSHSYLAHSVYGYFLNGGGNCYVINVGAPLDPAAAQGQLMAASDGAAPAERYVVKALEGGAAGNDITVEVADADDGSDPDAFKLIVRRGPEVLQEFNNLSTGKGKQNAVTVVRQQSRTIELVEAPNAPAGRPANGPIRLSGGGGGALKKIESSDYVGDPNDRTGFGGLEEIDDVTMVCVPDLMASYQQGAIDLDGVKAVQLQIIAHCELMKNRVAILDPPPGMNVQQIQNWRTKVAGYDSKYATLYWPWLTMQDPVTNASISVPPSGHIAGIWGRNDDTRGVHKAPANEVVRGVLNPAMRLTAKEQELLNPTGINCIRSFPTRGVRVWGARTLSSDAEWRYLNVRRLFNYLEESILIGTQWAVFEPNDHALWAKIRRTIVAFLTNEWRKGALFGLTPDEAFFVVCDATTNPPESIDAGQVICEVGVAPVKPAEFVVFQLSQFSGGASVAE